MEKRNIFPLKEEFLYKITDATIVPKNKMIIQDLSARAAGEEKPPKRALMLLEDEATKSEAALKYALKE